MLHPNLMFSEADVTKFRERMASDEKLRTLYEKTTADAENCLTEEFVTEAQANGRNTQSQHADFGSLNHQTNRLCSVLGTKYIFEGDERCAARLRDLLYHLISFERWYSISYAVRKPVPWHADLCSTATTLAAARVYDLIFDFLSEKERRELAAGLLEKGVYPALGDWVLPETRIHAIDSMGHNWWAVCISEAGAAFLALSDYVEESRKQEILGLVNGALAEYLTYPGNRLFNKFGNFDDGGMFYEGINYDNFGAGTLLEYLWSYERYFGKNDVIRNAVPKGFADAFMKFSYPVSKDGKTDFLFLNFGDSAIDCNISHTSKYAYLLGISSPAMNEFQKNYVPGLWDLIAGYDADKIQGSLEELPKTALFSSGFAIRRAAWEPDSTLFAVKSGFCWNHSHNDSGSFILWDKGKPLFTDDGTCNYDSPLYHAYYCQDHAHSVVKLGGKGRRDEELYRGTKFPGSVIDSFSSDSLFFVQADCTGPVAHLASRLYRNFLWFDDRILVILDDIYCHEEDTAQFTLHFAGDYEENGGAVDFSNGTSTARLLTHFPGGRTLTEKIGHEAHKEKETKPFIELSWEQPERTHLLINSIELDAAGHRTDYTPLHGENAEGLRIEDENTEREIWFNRCADGHVMHDNSNNVIAGFDTDAYMLLLTHDKKTDARRVLMICGSWLRKDGKIYLSGFSKMTKETLL